VKKFWCLFFILWSVIAVMLCWFAPALRLWFPGEPMTKIGEEIDGLFYLILIITSVTFVLTHIVLGYVLWRGAHAAEGKAYFTHGSHNLEVVWTIVPAGILLFIALYQLDVWAAYRVKETYDLDARLSPVAEVTARQFEWRIRYPAPGRKFKDLKDVETWLKHPEAGDLYTVNDLHVPTGRQVVIHLRSGDVQHSFFVPDLRVKQDAVPGLVVPVMFEVLKGEKYELVCAELCGWGHYKMKARVWAQPQAQFDAYLNDLQREQFDDGVPAEQESPEGQEN